MAALLLAAPLAAAGCGGGDKPRAVRPTPMPTTPKPVPVPLTPQVAARQFQTYVANEDVARSAADERLALTWTSDGQSQLTAAAFRKAAFDGDPVSRYAYGTPKLYVPRLKPDVFPQWFVASVRRSEQGEEKSARTALMAFILRGPSDRWKLSLTTLLAPKAKEPKVLLDQEGYAAPLADDDTSVLIRPRDVQGIQATIASEGPGSVASRVMRQGPVTTGYFRQANAAKKKAKAKDLTQTVVYVATPFPFFPLRTQHGGALVLYGMFRNTVIGAKDKENDKPPIPSEAEHLMDGVVEGNEISMTVTYQFAAYDPARAKGKDKPQPKADVVADAGELTKATAPPPRKP